MAVLPNGIRIYRKLRYHKGHGVHSPFAFNLITKVIEEKARFYVFDEIEAERSRMLREADRATRKRLRREQHAKYGSLLFRLVRFFQSQSILQVGGGAGIIRLYLEAAAGKTSSFLVIEDDLSQVEGIPDPDLIFINCYARPDFAREVWDYFADRAENHALVILDGITSNKGMRELWKSVQSHPKVSVTLNLHALGIVFLNNKLNKQHYKAYFDYGKKQNLHQIRRQRFHFLSRRKKSRQNSPQA